VHPGIWHVTCVARCALYCDSTFQKVVLIVLESIIYTEEIKNLDTLNSFSHGSQ
jgi:hypothetical protein